MKRKFAFSLAPVKVPSKTDAPVKPSPAASGPSIPLPPQSHHRHQSQDSRDGMSPLNSPFISRQTLSPEVHRELRAACALILQNFHPSDHGFVDVDPKLDFQAFNRRREPRRDHGPTKSRSHRALEASVETAKHSDLGTPLVKCVANTGRRRIEHDNPASNEHGAKRSLKSSSREPVRPTTVRSEAESDDTLATPLTGSTDAHLHNNGSTAPTSAALTSSGSPSKRGSRQYENPTAASSVPVGDTRQPHVERVSRTVKPRNPWISSDQALSRANSRANSRPPSRSGSIRSDFKNYIFPGSRPLSRSQSQESLSLHISNDQASQKEPTNSGSGHGWRSWGLQRLTSSRSSSRPGSSKGPSSDQVSEKKNEVNLNRELPPLPSLDSWKNEEQTAQKDSRKSQALGAHIATVMRPQDKHQHDFATAARNRHRRSGSDTLAMRYTASSHIQAASKAAPPAFQKKSQATQDSRNDFDDMMSKMDPSKRRDDSTRTESFKASSDTNRMEPPNFSRKISADFASPGSSHRDHPYQNVVQIPSQSSKQKQESKSKLKKVLSVWILRKDKKENWMDQLEKNGIKGGVMIQDEAALPPVVRY